MSIGQTETLTANRDRPTDRNGHDISEKLVRVNTFHKKFRFFELSVINNKRFEFGIEISAFLAKRCRFLSRNVFPLTNVFL